MAREARDFQRSKVYAWENETFPHIREEQWTLSQCEAFAKQLYGARVKIKDGRGRRSACAHHRRYPTISLPKWARNKWVVAHEVAHLKTRHDLSIPAHGAIFMGVYLGFLRTCTGVDYTECAKDYGLKVRSAPPV